MCIRDRGKLASQGVHLHIIAPLPGQSIDSAVFETMLRCDAFLALATKDYGADTGNTASTYHEVRMWKEKYQPKGKPLIPLRMVSGCFCCCARAQTLIRRVFTDPVGRRV